MTVGPHVSLNSFFFLIFSPFSRARSSSAHKRKSTSQHKHEQQEDKGKKSRAAFLSFSLLAWLSKLTAKNNAAAAKPKPSAPADKSAITVTGGFPSCFFKGASTSTRLWPRGSSTTAVAITRACSVRLGAEDDVTATVRHGRGEETAEPPAPAPQRRWVAVILWEDPGSAGGCRRARAVPPAPSTPRPFSPTTLSASASASTLAAAATTTSSKRHRPEVLPVLPRPRSMRTSRPRSRSTSARRRWLVRDHGAATTTMTTAADGGPDDDSRGVLVNLSARRQQREEGWGWEW
ncbi:hypothetical protein OsI_30484 [Oryza sativa Indica Group]|uniref:Uncharacterized protein n=1 Tax=Oryza sativa subsp. indica TaxID=39946 RepID=A2YYR7_ORYSI|nr:hypothetical protein OsI_30484 [Oryza sativa Indica Group]